MPGSFRSFRNVNFRWYAAASLLTNVAMWMQRISQDWLAVKIGGGSAVGIVTALQFLPILLVGPFAGTLADRFDRRKLLVATCLMMAAPSFLLAASIGFGSLAVWYLYGFALMLGVASAADSPARAAYVRNLVGDDDLVNAMGLNQINFHTSRIIGPTIAGFLIAATGIATAFVAVGVGYFGAIAVLLKTRGIDTAAGARTGPRAKPGLHAAMRQLREQPGLIVLILLTCAVSSFALNFQVTLTLMATQVFKLHAANFGALSSMMAAGSISGAFLVARLARPSYLIVFRSAGLLGVAYLVAVTANSAPLFGLCLIPIGLLSNMFLSTSNAVVQLRTQAHFQGRITGLYMAGANALVPLGAVLIGTAADRWTPRVALGVAGVICVAAAAATFAALLWLGVIRVHEGQIADVAPIGGG